ncbi:signal recognition particle-docking protein FtsY [Corynebacterium callunae]|uniref:signal recognition particle-docking protein FtsY n=1 Tax=Corynebacterium callunae TaxID=1721 RepID=UPI0039822785
MEPTMWIIGLVVLVVLAIIIVLIVGNQRAKSKTVSFEKPAEEKKELTQQEKSGNYQAQGGFNFAPAKKDAEPVLNQGQELSSKPAAETESATQPVAPQVIPPVIPPGAVQDETPAPAETAKPAETAEVADTKAEEAAKNSPTDTFAAQPAPEKPVVEEAAEKPAEQAPAVAEVSETPVETKPETEADTAAEVPEEISAETAEVLEEAPIAAEVEGEDHVIADEPIDNASPIFEETVENVAEPVAIAGAEAAENAEVQALQEAETEAVEAAEAAQVTAEFAEAAREQTPVPDTEPAPAAEPLDEIAPAAGRIGKLRGRLSRSQNVFGKSVLGILSAGDLDEDAWEDIEAMLIKADLGSKVTARVVDELREKIALHGVASEAEARAMLRQTLIDACRPDLDRSIKAMPYEGKPAVVLVVGVNGTGKTTTTGKLARVLVSMGHKVILGAADTFRAAAADQLETWGRRVGAETVRGSEGADPASVAFDAVAKGVERQADVVLIDTAGRLHTSTGLMDQLGKVKRVVEKKAVVDEVLLVLDSTVGQNGMQQARIFRDVVEITGVVLTKLDGTAKGGIVFQVQEELGVPVKLVGLGEGSDDLAPFEVEGFVDALLG